MSSQDHKHDDARLDELLAIMETPEYLEAEALANEGLAFLESPEGLAVLESLEGATPYPYPSIITTAWPF
jgi:hypothetical protein